MPKNSYLPFAVAAGANVWDDATFAGSSQQVSGITRGIVAAGLMSKAWRQSSVPASALGQIIVDHGLIDAPDDGNMLAFKANLRMATAAMLAGVAFAIDQSNVANTITVNLDPVPPDLSTYRGVFVKVSNTNTGAVSLKLNAFNPVSVFRKDGSVLSPGDIIGGQFYHFLYDRALGRWVVAGFVASDLLAYVSGVTRPRLAANTIFYVDPANGLDTNDGSSSAKAFRTRQKAWNTIVNTLDLAGNNVLVKLMPGTYTDAFLASCPVVGNSNGVGAVTFQGSVGSNAAAFIAPTSGNAWLAQGGASFALDSMTIQATGTNASGIVASVGAIIGYGNIVFNACNLNQVSAAAGGFTQQTGPVIVTGGAVNHVSASDAGSKVNIAGQSITFQNTPAFTQFAQTQGPSQITANALILTGGATGKQYNILGPGYLYLAGQTLPGNAAGTITTAQVG